MSVQRFKSLLFKSAQLQKEIEKEHRRRWPDWIRLLKLKKLRLMIGDRISKLVRQEQRYRLQPVKVSMHRPRKPHLRRV